MDSELKLLEDWQFRSWLTEHKNWFTPMAYGGGVTLFSLPVVGLVSSFSAGLAGLLFGVGVLVTVGLGVSGRIRRWRFLKNVSDGELYGLRVRAAVYKNSDKLPASLVNSPDPVIASTVTAMIKSRVKYAFEVRDLALVKARAGFRGTVGELWEAASGDYVRSLNPVSVASDESLRARQNTLLSTAQVLLDELPAVLSSGLRERFGVLRESAVRDLRLLEKLMVLGVNSEQLGRCRSRVLEANESLRLVVDELDALVVSTRPGVEGLLEDVEVLKEASVGLGSVKINA